MYDQDKRQKIGKRIAEGRSRLGFSQKKLGSKIHLSNSAISKYERGESLPPSDVIIALSDCFHVSADYLLRGKDKEYNEISNECIELLRIFNSLPQLKRRKIYKHLCEIFRLLLGGE